MKNVALCNLRFIGEVVETSRGAERCFAKVAIRHICVEIPSDNCETISLGDMVAFETGITAANCRGLASEDSAETMPAETMPAEYEEQR